MDYELAPEEIKTINLRDVHYWNSNEEILKIGASKQLSKVLCLQAKADPDLREALKAIITAPIPDWRTPNAYEKKLEDVLDQILTILTPLIEQAKKEERERILNIGWTQFLREYEQELDDRCFGQALSSEQEGEKE